LLDHVLLIEQNAAGPWRAHQHTLQEVAASSPDERRWRQSAQAGL